MLRKEILLGICLSIGLVLAGCVETPPGAKHHDGEGADGHSDDGALGEDHGLGQGWSAYKFDRAVEPAEGERGHVRAFSYLLKVTESEGVSESRIDVEVLGKATENLRVTKMDFASGNYEGEVISTPAEVYKLRHTLTVITDATGEREPEETATVLVSVPLETLGSTTAFQWLFSKIESEVEGETSVMEWYLTPEMLEEMEAGSGAVYLPYTEGDGLTEWWGFEALAGTYGLSFLSAYAQAGAEFSEGEVSFGGFTHRLAPTTIRVSDYTFDGWRVAVTGGDGEIRVSYEAKVSEALPLPGYLKIESTHEEGVEFFEYTLTDLVLGDAPEATDGSGDEMPSDSHEGADDHEHAENPPS